jgi:hypothetical protein
MQTLLPACATKDSTLDVQEFQTFYQKNLSPIYRMYAGIIHPLGPA